MKKIVFAITALILSAFMLWGCSGEPTVSNRNVVLPSYAVEITSESIDDNLREFLGINLSADGIRGNRTPSSESEKAAAEWLYNRYAKDEKYSALEVSLMNFDFTVNGKKRSSQNVEVRLTGTESEGRQIIIGTSYDNGYGTLDEEYTGNEPSTGAYTATGVATIMSMIDACVLSGKEIKDKDVVFVFFGCGVYNSYGAEAYIKDMSSFERANTVEMINLGNFGGERLYVYCDEAETELELSIRAQAANSGMQFYGMPANIPIISDASYIEGINYVHYGMLSDHAVFMEAGIPSAYLFSGYYGGFNLSELEKKGESNVSGTKADTYVNLVKKRADYAVQGSDVATLLFGDHIISALADYKSGGGYADYKTWLNPLWAYLTVIFTVIVLCVILIVLVKYFEKKHPFVPVVKRMKIAVFGMDYEEKTDEDIFIDIKKPRNPFDGY